MRSLAAALAVAVAVVALGAQPPAADPASASTAATDTASGEAVLTTSARASDDPVIVVLDISGSMADDDGNGIVKIDAARRSVKDLIRAQGAGAVFGLWTYPTGEDCDAGEYLIPPEPIADVERAAAQVDAISPSGGTPTGAALSAAVAELSARGYTGATVVLVSDGESNCDSPPCAVAKRLTASGFQVTVDAVGFQQSEAGRAELSCVANATGGSYFDAEDSDALVDHLASIGQPRLALAASVPSSVLVGTVATVEVHVTNPSVRAVRNARVTLTFVADDRFSAMPAVVPPTLSLGNLPAGASIVRTWRVSIGGAQRTDTTHAHFIVRAWASDAEAAVVDGRFVVSTALPGVDSLAGLLAGVAEGGHPIVVAGDSFSAGEGAGDYLVGSSGAADVCHRSLQTYLSPVFADRPELFDMVACSGATTRDIFAAQRPAGFGGSSQEAQVRAIADPGAVVLTIGGNDILFADVASACIQQADCSMDTLVRSAMEELIPAVGTGLTESYERLWLSANSAAQVEARGGTYAPVIVLPYPMLLHESRFGPCAAPMSLTDSPIDPAINQFFGISVREVDFLNRLEAALNEKVRESVAAAVADGYEVYAADDTVANAFRPEHTTCETGSARYTTEIVVESTNPLVVRQDSMHPNAAGYRATTAAFVTWLGGDVALVAPDPDRISRNLPAGWGTWNPVAAAFSASSVDLDAQGATVAAGTTVRVRVDGFARGAQVAVALHSTPRTLGAVRADENGVVDAELTVPPDVPTGGHTLVATGFGAEGELVVHEVIVRIVPEFPVWVALVLLAGMSALLAAVVILVIMYRRGTAGAVEPPTARGEEGAG